MVVMMCNKCEQLWLASMKQPIAVQQLIDGGEERVFNGMCNRIAATLQVGPATVMETGVFLRLHGPWYFRLHNLFKKMERLGVIRKAEPARKRNVRWILV
jgi:hypothetical protein